MPSRWQVEAVSTQMKQLETQKNNLTPLIEKIDSALLQGNEWISGKDTSTSFPEICEIMELTCDDITTTCVDISRVHEIHPSSSSVNYVTVLEQASDIQQPMSGPVKLIRTAWRQRENSYMQELDARISKLEATNSSIKKASKHNEEMIRELQTEVKANYDELKMVSVEEKNQLKKCVDEIQTLKSVSHSVADLKQEIDVLKDGGAEMRVTIQNASALAITLEKDSKKISQKYKELDDNLKKTAKKQDEFSSMLRTETSRREEQYGMVCDVLHKRLLPLEQLRETFNRAATVRDERQIKDVNSRVTELEVNFNALCDSTIQQLTSRTAVLEEGVSLLQTETEANSQGLTEKDQRMTDIENQLQARCDNIESSIQNSSQLIQMIQDDLQLLRNRNNVNGDNLPERNNRPRDNGEADIPRMDNNLGPLESNLHSLVTANENNGVGFTVVVPTAAAAFGATEIITSFTVVRFNYGNHYNVNTGRFTVPATGLYLLCLNLRRNSGSVLFRVEKQAPGTAYLTPVTHLSVYANETSASHATVELLNAGDTIMLRSFSCGGLSEFSSYTGLLLCARTPAKPCKHT